MGNDFVAIATGSNDGSLVIKTNGTLAGWGNNCVCEVSAPDGSFIAIDVGQRHSVALRSSGYLYAWGGLFWPYGYDEGDEPEGGVVSSPVIERYSYDVYGQTTIKAPDGSTRTTSAYGNRFMFTGREYDKEAGLYYYRERYYSPTLGRFLQTDPIFYLDGLNLYSYCGNNPLNWIDPWGLASMEDYYYGWYWAKWLYEHWENGTGPACWVFRGNHPFVNLMKDAPGVNDAREAYKKKPEKAGIKRHYDFDIKNLEPISSGPNPARQFLGSYDVTISPNANGTRTVKINNTTSMSSYTRYWKYFGSKPLPSWERSVYPPCGNMRQEIIWDEEDD